MTDLNNINIEESTNQSSKFSKFVENTKRAVGNVLVKTGIGASSLMPMASATTPSVVPASVNTITAITPIASTVAKTITLGAAAELLAACGGGEDGPDTPVNPEKPVEKDITPPTIDVTLSEVDITGGKQIRIDGNKLYIGSDLVASRSDNKTTSCSVTLSINGTAISSGSSIDNEGTLNIQVKDEAGNSKNIDIKLDKYKTMEITNIKPSDILPILKQIKQLNLKDDTKYLDVIKLAEATRIRDMMREYGAGNHSKEEYQALMSKLNTGMMGESPIGYDNFETIGENIQESYHAYRERNILNTIINHTNFKVISGLDKLCNLAKQDPNKINIIGLSMSASADKEEYNKWGMDYRGNQLKMKNLILLGAGSNIRKKDGILVNKIYQENYDLPDDHSIYTNMSAAHNKNDNNLDKHILITIGTDKNGDIDQTNEISESSKFPVGFHDKVLFSGHSFPYSINGDFQLESGKYATSYTNYVNVAMMDLCFQMFAEVKDVDELLEMIRSTALTDYIRFDLNGDGDTDDNYDSQPETQPLQLINPSGFFQKYLMPKELPTSIKSGENIQLKKGYYKGVIFNIPGAEVKINGEWIEYSEKNKSLIKDQNPMNLQWRLNGDLCKKIYGEGKTIQGKIITVDDKWNGLNIEKSLTINIQ